MIRRILISLLFTLAARSAGAAVAVDDFFLGVENMEIQIPFEALLANDIVGGREHWEVVLASVPAGGHLSVSVNGFGYKPAEGAWGVETFTYFLRRGTSSTSPATVRLHVSPLWSPIAGNWDGDSDVEVGAFNGAPKPFFLLCENMAQEPFCPMYSLPSDSDSAGFSDFAGFLPIAGNWGGDPADEVGLYDPVSGRFYLFDLGPDRTLQLLSTFTLGEGGRGNLPLAGNWNGDGTDTVGLRLAATGEFALRDEGSNGNYDHVFEVEGSQPGWLPFAGNWRPAGTSGVGLYDPIAGGIYLRADLTSGPAEWEFDPGLSAEEGPFVPVFGMGGVAGVPDLFTFIFFSRTPSSLVFYLFHTGDTVLPHLKVVIPTDPDDPMN